MAASSAIVLYESKTLSDGSHPIAIRLIFDRTPRYITIGKVKKEFWEEGSNTVKKDHPNHKYLNGLIKTKDTQAYDLILEYEKGNSGLTPDKIVAKLKGKKVAETLFDFYAEYVEEYKAKKKIHLAGAHESRAKNIWRFLNGQKFPITCTKERKYNKNSILRERTGKDLPFYEITAPFLRKLDIFLSVDLGLNARTIFNHMNTLRTLYNRAKNAKIVKDEDYPFKEYKLSMPESLKIPLKQDEIDRLENVVIESKTESWMNARDAWMFSYCFGGARITDVLLTRFDDFINGELHYVMGKNNKPVSIKTPKRIQKVLEYYLQFKEENQGFVFPALRNADLNDPIDVERKLRNANNLYNKWLKKLGPAAEIETDITPHIARHSFGAAAAGLIPLTLLQRIYRHEDPRTTAVYQQVWVDLKEIHEAVELIVDKKNAA